MAADVEVTHLAPDDDLEDHAGLVRGSVERCRTQQRNAAVDSLMLHQRINPLDRVRRAADLIFRAKYEIEAVPGTCQAALVDRARNCRRQCRRPQGKRSRYLIPGKVGPAAGE